MQPATSDSSHVRKFHKYKKGVGEGKGRISDGEEEERDFPAL